MERLFDHDADRSSVLRTTRNDDISSAPALAMSTLGTFSFRAAGHQIHRWYAGKARVLLLFLLLNKGQVMTREALYDALWPEAPRSNESSSLKVAVHMLRSVLSQQNELAAAVHRDDAEGPYLRVVTHDLGYVLEANDVWVDFEVFERLTGLAQSAQAGGDSDRAFQLYSRAIQLYQGEFLPGVNLNWAEVHRTWLRGTALLALESLIEYGLQRGNYIAVIRHGRRMLEIEPLREETYRILIMVHAQLGHLSQVRRWYELCGSLLRTELQVDVDPSTIRLYRQAMRGELTGTTLDPIAVSRGRWAASF